MKIIIPLLIVLLISFSGCATLFGKKSHPFAVSSTPTGAEIYINGFKMGVTPVELDLKADKDYIIECRLENYENVT